MLGEPLLDGGVAVLLLGGDGELATDVELLDLLEPPAEPRHFVVIQRADLAEHAGVSARGPAVITHQALIELVLVAG